jgi:DsbC/DsbD-like thiol-disulfide interchange protein
VPHEVVKALLNSHPTREPRQRSQRRLTVATIAALIVLSSPTPFAAQTAATDRPGNTPRSHTADTESKVAADAGDVKVRIALSEARAIGGQRIGVTVDFDIAPGWHVYGKPLPEDYTPTAVVFDSDLLSGQNLDFPKPTPVKFELLGETLLVYQGRFKAAGNILLRQELTPGEHRLGGTLSFQECNDNLCKMPQQVRFEIPLWIAARR